MAYSANKEQKFNGQRIFRDRINADFPDVWVEVMGEGFQTGWKNVTGCPQHGNHNPNWKDCLTFLEAVVVERPSLMEKRDPPHFPFERGFDRLIKGSLERKAQWQLMYQTALVYQALVKRDTKCKRNGPLNRLYNSGAIGITNNDIDALCDSVLETTKG